LTEALYLLGLIEAQANNFDLAAELFQAVVATNPAHTDAQYLLGLQLDKLGRTDEAIEHWKLAAQANPPSLAALSHLAQALAKSDDPEAPVYQETLENLLEQIETQFNAKSAEPTEAHPASHTANNSRSKNHPAQYEALGVQSAHAENWTQAINEIREAIRECPGDKCAQAARLHRHLGVFFCRTGKIDQARTELAKALALDPADAEARHASAALASTSAH
jgi:tetratricopeptide (TPR) repeat protein